MSRQNKCREKSSPQGYHPRRILPLKPLASRPSNLLLKLSRTPPTTRSKTVSHLSGIQALATTNSNERGETPGKKRKKDETRSPVIVQPLPSSVPETSSADYPNYYTVSIKKINGQPFSKDRIMQIRKAVFLIAKVNFELVFKQDESIDIYFTSSQAADHVLSKSKEIILDGSKILATKKMWKSYTSMCFMVLIPV